MKALRRSFSDWYRLTIIAPALFLLNPTGLSGQPFQSQSGHAEFRSRVPLHSFAGISEFLVGHINLADSTVDFYLDLSTLKTGMGKRDKDMRITLDVDQFPFAEFYGKLVTNIDSSMPSWQPVQVEGDFTIHGRTKQITVEGFLKPAENGLHVRAEWKLKLSDYEIEPPRFLIMKVDEVQEIAIDILLSATTMHESDI